MSSKDEVTVMPMAGDTVFSNGTAVGYVAGVPTLDGGKILVAVQFYDNEAATTRELSLEDNRWVARSTSKSRRAAQQAEPEAIEEAQRHEPI